LEYPIVFCSFLWSTIDPARRELQFHDRSNGDALTFSLRGNNAGTEEQLRWATEEAISEDMRMLYVAVTRAKNRCIIHVPDYQDVAGSPLAHLFPETARGDLATALRKLAAENPDVIGFSEPLMPDARGPNDDRVTH